MKKRVIRTMQTMAIKISSWRPNMSRFLKYDDLRPRRRLNNSSMSMLWISLTELNMAI